MHSFAYISRTDIWTLDTFLFGFVDILEIFNMLEKLYFSSMFLGV